MKKQDEKSTGKMVDVNSEGTIVKMVFSCANLACGKEVDVRGGYCAECELAWE